MVLAAAKVSNVTIAHELKKADDSAVLKFDTLKFLPASSGNQLKIKKMSGICYRKKSGNISMK